MTLEQLKAALEHTYGITPGHAAELAAAHNGKLPADVDKIPLKLPDPETVWLTGPSIDSTIRGM